MALAAFISLCEAVFAAFCVIVTAIAACTPPEVCYSEDEPDNTSHYNTLRESHLRLVRGEYPPQSEGWDSQAFALDTDPRPAA